MSLFTTEMSAIALEPKLIGSLGDSQKAVFGADTSYSMDGKLLKLEESLMKSITPNGKVITWSTAAKQPRRVSETKLVADGCTEPSKFFEMMNGNADIFILATDGEVDSSNVRKMTENTSANHIPCLLIIMQSGCIEPSKFDVSESNISVLFPAFASSHDAAILICNGNTTPYLITAKGIFEEYLPRTPELDSGIMLNKFPQVPVEKLHSLPVYQYPKVSKGTFIINDGRTVNTEEFLKISTIEIMSEFSQEDITGILRMLHLQGNLREARKMFNNFNSKVTQQQHARVESSTDTDSIQYQIQQLHRMSRDSPEATVIRDNIRQQLTSGRERKNVTATNAASKMKIVRALIQHALAMITHLEDAGHSASALSNRAKRADKVDTASMDLTDLDTDGAPLNECPITMDDDTVVAVMCIKMDDPESNTRDFSLNFPLCTVDNAGLICNGIIGVEAADQITTNPFTREPIDFIPIVKLTPTNKKEVYIRLCNIFMGGYSMHHVWSIAITAFVKTMSTQEWAAPGTIINDCLKFMINEIMNTINAPGGTIVNPGETALLKDVIAQAIVSPVMQMHYPIMGVIIAMELNNICPSSKVPITLDVQKNAMTSRLHAMIVQRYLDYLKKGGKVNASLLWTKIFDVRVDDNGIFQPIIGTHKILTSFSGILPIKVQDALDAWVHPSNAMGADSLIVPVTTIVITTTLKCVTPLMASARAVDEVAKHENVATAFDALTVGVLTPDEAMSFSFFKWFAMRDYPISKLPPFSTSGASAPVLYFYTGDGVIINMAEDSKYFKCTPKNEEEWMEFTEIIRTRRASLLDTYQGFNHGTFNRNTNATTLHRDMANVRASGVDPLSDEFGPTVVQTILGKRCGSINSANLEKHIAMLVPTLMQVPCYTTHNLTQETSSPLMTRLKIEVGDQIPSKILPQPEIWIPEESEVYRDRVNKYRNLMQEKVALAIAIATQKPVLPQASAVLSTLKNRNVGIACSWFLRRGVDSANIGEDGYVNVKVIIEHFKTKNKLVSLEQLYKVCEEDLKMRFSMKSISHEKDDDQFYMRANNGHSIEKVKEEKLMDPITEEEIPAAIHATTMEALKFIFDEGLSPMTRRCIQMACGPPSDPSVKSGVRKTSPIHIWIDVGEAMKAGIKFFRTENGVICSPDNIPSKFFSRVQNIVNGDVIV